MLAWIFIENKLARGFGVHVCTVYLKLFNLFFLFHLVPDGIADDMVDPALHLQLGDASVYEGVASLRVQELCQRLQINLWE